MNRLFALYIGINDYPEPVNPLKGCVQDVARIATCIQELYADYYEIEEQKLLNERATKKAIIDAFNYFEQATKGDICLLYYAGHGSVVAAPDALKHLEPNGMLETLVCYDSRLAGGMDLIDKELSYLIWKATKDKAIQFVSIMDCCHSGQNTRAVSIRRTQASDRNLLIDNLVGYQDFLEVASGQCKPPVGRHLSLSACRDIENAKEVKIANQSAGVFTYALTTVLKQYKGWINYRQLVHQTRITVKQFFGDQSPQLFSTHISDQSLGFLSHTEIKEDRPHLLFYDRGLARWAINIGALHGLSRFKISQFKIEGIAGIHQTSDIL
ncbi:MAG: caspase family protein, partial [Bacteroidota bacterium]